MIALSRITNIRFQGVCCRGEVPGLPKHPELPETLSKV